PLLNLIASSIKSGAVWLFLSESSQTEATFRAGLPETPPDGLAECVSRSLRLDDSSPAFLSQSAFSPPGLSAALCIALHHMDGSRLGVLVLGSAALNNDQLLSAVDPLTAWIEMLRSLLEAERLRQEQIAAQLVRQIAGLIPDQPDPQAFVNILSTSPTLPAAVCCGLLFYGPLREDRPDGPFDYLEVVGSWSRPFGSGAGLGMRFYVESYHDLLDELERNRVYYLSEMSKNATEFDALARGFLRGLDCHSLLVVPLSSGERRLGLLAVGSASREAFGEHDRRTLQMVADLIAVSAITRVLHHQQDFVQRARTALLDAVNEGVLMILPSGWPLMKESAYGYSVTVNRCFTSMFQVNPARAVGVPLRLLLDQMRIPAGVRRSLLDTWTSIPVRDPRIQQGTFDMIHTEGYPASVEWYSAPVYQDERVLGRIYTFHDVTSHQTALRLRADFMSRMSHELRTPLTSINGFAQLILEQAESLNPDALEYTHIISESAHHLVRLVSQIIEITRADTGELQLNAQDITIQDILRDLIAHVESQARARGCSIQLESRSESRSLHVDPNRIGQALAQVIDNALKHSPEGGTISIEVMTVTQAADLPPNSPPDLMLPAVLVAINDQGVGLSHEETAQVFLPFYRTAEARAAKLPGSGLGLTSARALIERHHGKIWAESRRRGRSGGRFWLSLPLSADV
ncbi:MAG: GAF domain-containing sensor histidine kinase, partial [Anaerolineae bacterium]|nr:GAF domain-containing sensor histidine kinase [Anaerolineae bacterium]